MFEFLFFYPIKIYAKDINRKKSLETSKNSHKFFLNRTEHPRGISNDIYLFKNEVIKDINLNGSELFKLLAFEPQELEENYFVEIDSDIQYRDKDIFTAEGNAIINLSDATLKGDLVKYDTSNKLLTVTGNVIFTKGEQYFEASKLHYNLRDDTGYVEDVYGLLDSKTFAEDFKLELRGNERQATDEKNKNGVNQPRYVNTATIGLVNQFEDAKAFNIKEANINIPTISRWRYKTNKLEYNSKTIESKKIFFTNDIYNQPQFVFLSKNFSAEIKKSKLKLLSRNSWIILDNKLKIPIGRRSVFDRDPLTKWGVGADFQDKDGYYLFRSTKSRNIFRDYDLQLQPYFLIQRALKDNTSSFTSKNASIFSDKVKNELNFYDYFALDLTLKGKEGEWDIDSKVQLNSLNFSRLDESFRTKFTFSKSIDLTSEKKSKKKLSFNNVLDDFIGVEESNNSISIFDEKNKINSENNNSKKNEGTFNNLLNFQIYNVFREKVTRDFATEEIYFASGFNISNNRSWVINDKNSNLFLTYDVGHFKSESLSGNEFNELFRNTFVTQYNYKFPLWKKNTLDKMIDRSYKFTPKFIEQSLDWSTGIQYGLFLYSDESNQNALKFSTGPVLTLGSFKRNFLDYTKVNINYNYVMKGGESPFKFDNINKDPRINFNFKQQIYGPLLFSFDTTLNLDSGSYTNINYALDFKRRAYSIGAFYNSSDESLGIRFNIFNFDYSGLSPKF